MRRFLRALTAASVRSLAPSFSRRLSTWPLTVLGLIPKALAISLLESPRVMSLRTSRSRSLRRAASGGVTPLGLTRAYLGRRAWAPLVLAVAGGAFWVAVAKWALARERPHPFPSPVREAGYSFPSGHAEVSLALVLSLYLLLGVSQPRGNRLGPAFWVLALGLPWAFLVGLSRLYLQVHYPSDALGGWALAVAWTLWVWRWTPSRF